MNEYPNIKRIHLFAGNLKNGNLSILAEIAGENKDERRNQFRFISTNGNQYIDQCDYANLIKAGAEYTCRGDNHIKISNLHFLPLILIKNYNLNS